jgi:tetratricopeptide (TPR) repeat protein
MLAAIVWLLRRPETRLVAFGLIWFLVTLAPTSSVFPLAEVENGHRTFLPYVGLFLGCLGVLAIGWSRVQGRLDGRRWAMPAIAGLGAVVLVANAAGTIERNRVWRDGESLWRDCVAKSPANGRAWTNFGLAQMERNRLDEAIASFSRAMPLLPAWPYVHINMAIALATQGRDVEAESEFKTSVALARTTAEPYFFYGRFLVQRRRFGEAREQALQALASSPAHLDAHHLLLEVDRALGNTVEVRRDAQRVLSIWPGDEFARRALDGNEAGVGPGTPEEFVASSLEHFQAGRNDACIAACRKALALRPDYPEAWNNICAASNNLGRWDDAIAACREAVRLAPKFELARNNLRWAESQKAKISAGR